jgi:enterochelin esterase-like enzyme
VDPGRRRLLIGGSAIAVVGVAGGFGLVEERVLPGRSRLDVWMGACGSEEAPPTGTAGPMVSGTFRSAARRGIDVGWTVAYPPRSPTSAALPVCLLLHARGGTHRWPFDRLGVQHHLAAAVGAGAVRPFALVSADGGDHVNWHPRANGDDPQRMVVDELLPMLADRGLQTSRVGVWGWSLGGYGALLLAQHLGASRVAAVAAASPAIWTSYRGAQPGTFDNAADFDRNDVLAHTSGLSGISVRVDTGSDDPFAGTTRQLLSSVHPTPAGGVSGGCHDPAFWSRHAAAQLAFVGSHLSAS